MVSGYSHPKPHKAPNVWDFIRIVYKALCDPLTRELGGLARFALCAYERHSKPNLNIKHRKNCFHEYFKGIQPINIYFEKPATGNATASLGILLSHCIRILLDHVDPLCTLGVGHPARGF